MEMKAVPRNSPAYNDVIREFKKTSPNFTVINVWIRVGKIENFVYRVLPLLPKNSLCLYFVY